LINKRLEMRKTCDKCKSKIVDGKCDCGVWYEKKEQPLFAENLERAMLAYNELGTFDPISGDHHSGSCIVLFKGKYEDCEEVKKFIGSLKEKQE